MNILPPAQNNAPPPLVRTDLSPEMRLALRDYILKTLQLVNQDGSYGVLSCTANHPLIVLFGFPVLKDMIPIDPAPYDIPILLRGDRIERGANITPTTPILPNRWVSRPVVHAEKLCLKMFSIGQKGTPIQIKIISRGNTNTRCLTDSLQEGGSFGGLFRESAGTDQVFGITAAHCLEHLIPEVTALSIPSTLEINARAQSILRYTTLSTEKIHQKASKEREVRRLFEQFTYSASAHGLSFKAPDTGVEKVGVLCGTEVGTVYKHMNLIGAFTVVLSRVLSVSHSVSFRSFLRGTWLFLSRPSRVVLSLRKALVRV